MVHFEKKKRVGHNTSKMGNSDEWPYTSQDSKLPKRQNNLMDESMEWQDMASDWRRCESMYLSWTGGYGPFNINATSYPDNSYASSSDQATQWQIASLVGNHNYYWTGALAFLFSLLVIPCFVQGQLQVSRGKASFRFP